jgi:hypothetical protein
MGYNELMPYQPPPAYVATVRCAAYAPQLYTDAILYTASPSSTLLRARNAHSAFPAPGDVRITTTPIAGGTRIDVRWASADGTINLHDAWEIANDWPSLRTRLTALCPDGTDGELTVAPETPDANAQPSAAAAAQRTHDEQRQRPPLGLGGG